MKNERTTGTRCAGEFVHVIRVTWGDCDPAKIVYTPRVPAFALEAIDAWWEHHLGGCGWYHLNIDRNTGTPFVHMSIDFSAPITPRHRLFCTVRPKKLGETSIEFEVLGSQDCTQCFVGRFICVFVIADKHEKRKIPQDIREIVEPLLKRGSI
ncbi:MAG: acyl-CoA thioesterase [Rhodobacteraceae bacterium]|nr:acyl-CoA thioesterase [Paracoccaceae bacterium]